MEGLEPDQAVLVVLDHVLVLVFVLGKFLAKSEIDLLELLLKLREEFLED